MEFGHKAEVADNEDGVVRDYTVEPGNPADAPQLEPAVERIKRRTGRPPRTVTADRGYREKHAATDGTARLDTTEGSRIWTGHGVRHTT